MNHIWLCPSHKSINLVKHAEHAALHETKPLQHTQKRGLEREGSRALAGAHHTKLERLLASLPLAGCTNGGELVRSQPSPVMEGVKLTSLDACCILLDSMLLKNGIYSLERPFPLLALLWKNNKSSMQTGHSSSCCWGISWSKLKICDSFTPALITHPTEHACATHGDQLKPIGQTTLTGKSKQSGRSERFSRPSVRAVTFARLKPRLMSSWTVRGAWPNHGCKGPGTSSVSKCWHLFLTGTVPHQGSQTMSRKELGLANRCGGGGSAAAADRKAPSQVFRCLCSVCFGAAKTRA